MAKSERNEKMKAKSKKPRCYNCKFAGSGFKLSKLTYHYCNHSKHEQPIENGEMHPLDTLMVFSDTCDDHEYKN